MVLVIGSFTKRRKGGEERDESCNESYRVFRKRQLETYSHVSPSLAQFLIYKLSNFLYSLLFNIFSYLIVTFKYFSLLKIIDE